MENILQQLLGGRGAPTRERYKNVFTLDFDHDDLWDALLETDTVNHEITCTAGIWTVIGRYQVKSQQQIRWGYGSAAFPTNQGRAYVAVYDDTATNSVLVEGKLRLAQRDYEDVVGLKVKEKTTQEFRFGEDDPRQRQPIPEQLAFPKVGRDSYLELILKARATDDVIIAAIGTALGKDIWNIPATFYIL